MIDWEFGFGADLDLRLWFNNNSDLLFVSLCADLIDTLDPLTFSVVA